MPDSAHSATLEEEAPGRSRGAARLLYLDNIRAALITLVVLGHLAITYGIEGDWNYRESGEVSAVASILFLPLVAIGAAFALGLFMLLAGYFTPGPFERKGAGGFLLDRVRRLGIPLLFYQVIALPLITYVVDRHDGEFQGSLWQFIPIYARNVRSFGSGPVWFLEALLILSCLYAGWRLATRRAAASPQGGPPRDRAVPGSGAIALFALAIGLVTFLVRIWAPVNLYVEPWHLEPAHLPQYVACFAAGILAYHGRWLDRFTDTQARAWRWIALLCVLSMPVLAVAAGALTGTLDERGAGGLNWLSLAYSIWEGLTCVAMTITALSWFRRRFSRQRRVARALSQASFGVYVLHPLIIVPLAVALSGIRMNLTLKFVLVAPPAVALCYLVCYGLRRLPVVRSVL